MAVYILHFEENYHHARHYIGFTNRDIETRFFEHIIYHKSPLIDAVIKAGIKIRLAKVFKDQGREFERQLKKQKCTSRYCPICRQAARRKKNQLVMFQAGEGRT